MIPMDFHDNHYDAFIQRQKWPDKYDIYKNVTIIAIESSVVVEREDGGPWTHIAQWCSMAQRNPIIDPTWSV